MVRARRRFALPVGSGGTVPLASLNAATAPGNGIAFNVQRAFSTWNSTVAVTGAPSGFSVQLQGSLDGAAWTNIGAAQVSAGTQITQNVPWTWVRSVLGSLTGGTNPTVSAVVVGY